MTTLKPYPDYCVSGVEWLGEIPSHWDIVTLRYKYSVQLGKMLDAKRITGKYLTPYLRNVDVRWGHVSSDNLPSMDIAPGEFDRYTVRPGDLLVCEGGEVGRSAIWRHDEPVGFQKALHRLRPLNPATDTSEYFYYVMVATAQRGVFAAQGNENTFNHLTGEAFRAYRFAFPPLDEQRAVAAFLDAMDARITRFIAARKKMIRLLEEKKQAVINQAVTKGLNPTAPMKDTGVDWLGEIPAHWEVGELRRLVSIAGGMTPSKNVPAYWQGDIPWVSPKDMKSARIAGAQDHISEEAVQTTGLSVLQPGTVLIVVRGMILARRVPVAVCDVPVTINQDMKGLLPADRVLADYLLRVLQAGQDAMFPLIDEAGHGTRRLPTPALLGIQLPLPPPEEQRAICSKIDEETARVSASSARAHSEIELIQEYRTRLISDVVTGKLDVRGVDLGDLPMPAIIDDHRDDDHSGDLGVGHEEAGYEEDGDRDDDGRR